MTTDGARAPSLSEAVSAYRAERMGELKPQALTLLTRLANSSDAAKAFKRLKPADPRAEADLLRACIAADNLAHDFPRLTKKQRDLLGRAKRWEDGVVALRKFVDEIDEQGDSTRIELAGLDLWSLSMFEPPSDSAALRNAVDLIASTIEWRRGIAEANLAHIGATRDTQIKQAAQNSAIWILAAGVYDAGREPPLPGRPHVKEIADLAGVILGIYVSDDRVREVLRKRRQLYINMFGKQTKRLFSEKAAQARRRAQADKAVR